MTRILVVGGGIAGLAAAWDCVAAGCDVTLVEGSPRLGGKIETVPFAGLELDTGPDSFLARVPAAAALARAAGLSDSLIGPATGQAYLWTRGRLRELPTGTVLGVPLSLAALPALARSGVMSWPAVARAALDPVLPGRPLRATDISVGELVGRRMGRGLQAGVVDPLVGGINAGSTSSLSAAIAAPQLLDAARRDRSLIRGLRRPPTQPASQPPAQPASQPGGPVFLTVQGGLGRLVSALAAAVPRVVLSDPVVTLRASEGPGWMARLRSGDVVTADGVVLACPAAAAATLLQPLSPVGARSLGEIRTTSVVMTLLSYPIGPDESYLPGSGFLVPRSEGRLLTAASWVGAKWPHLSTPGRLVVRASAGRSDDTRAWSMSDDELVRTLHAELAEAMGLPRPPEETMVTRWPDAFPQYPVGHLDRIAAIEERLARDTPRLVLAGASLRGVGVATCITGAQAAAARLRERCAS